ncbi:glycosyltransferase family 39 protein [Luteimonas sp. M1R5S18]|uniref:Glycosyltransferase family 39 protein n=1 Tax=Luteimonas rhizosphaericola TaxID=3042024 RepID=A0ABT6JIY9_9GAMM|nr:glycosyltransferase family 39 protein [Luteimonas rhizosphaericola]MDH5830649.1 glycosyltransferase family 39 protein [Luteimonas rhizosphaericola]
MPDSRTPRIPRRHLALLWWLIALSLAAGIGWREPMPPDEPRFALAARTMVDTGDWLFPHRGSELYAEKPPVFMWLQAAAFVLVRDWRIAFLLPSLLAALGTLWLCGDLARRLWGRRAVRWAVGGLFVCLQFALQAKRGQIDMVLVAMTTLSLWALLRYLLLTPRAWLLALGCFAAGLGTVTKGVGFLPLLVFVPWGWLRAKGRTRLPAHPSVHALAGVGGFLAGVGTWLAPMLGTALASGDPALLAYAREMLLRQTGERYANAWHHVQPAWYYLQAMALLWLPGSLLAPWLLPAWWRRARRLDPRVVLLLGWSLLVLAFFSASPGKREVYVLPMLPALCVAAAPLLPGLLRRRGVRAALWAYLAVLALGALGAGAWLAGAPVERLLALTRDRGLDAGVLPHMGAWLLALGVMVSAVLAFALRSPRRRLAPALVVATALLWTCHGAGLLPALSPGASAQALMQRVGRRIGPDAELALLGWREQHLLQADRPVVDFGFKRPLATQWTDAGRWLQADPARRWLFLDAEALVPCLDRAKLVAIGASNRRRWLLAPGAAWIPGCTPSEDAAPAR